MENGIRKDAVTAFLKQKKVFANRSAVGSGYDWHWTYKSLKKRLKAIHLTLVVAYYAAKVHTTSFIEFILCACLALHRIARSAPDAMQGEELDLAGLSADFFRLHTHLQPFAPDARKREELAAAGQQFSAKLASVLADYDLLDFWTTHNSELLPFHHVSCWTTHCNHCNFIKLLV